MASLGLARFFAEVSPDVRHAFTAPEDGTSPTKVKGVHWNAAHDGPDLEFAAFPGLVVQAVQAYRGGSPVVAVAQDGLRKVRPRDGRGDIGHQRVDFGCGAIFGGLRHLDHMAIWGKVT